MFRKRAFKGLFRGFLEVVRAQSFKTVFKIRCKFFLVYLGIASAETGPKATRSFAFGGPTGWSNNLSSNLRYKKWCLKTIQLIINSYYLEHKEIISMNRQNVGFVVYQVTCKVTCRPETGQKQIMQWQTGQRQIARQSKTDYMMIIDQR